MRLNSDTPLAVELRDQDVRRYTVESQIKIGLPFQLRGLREHRGWTQETLAQKIGTTQNTISRLENPKTGKPTITTLLRIANACDVGLLVRFAPFGFYGDVIEGMDQTHVEIPSYEEELQHQIESEWAIAVGAGTLDRGAFHGHGRIQPKSERGNKSKATSLFGDKGSSANTTDISHNPKWKVNQPYNGQQYEQPVAR
jgi:transcriptional regulator with XRE-family HTH domain